MFLDDLKAYGEDVAKSITESAGTAVKAQVNKGLNVDTSVRSSAVAQNPDFTAQAARVAQDVVSQAKSNLPLIIGGVAVLVGVYFLMKRR